jgi:hypothetical protein
MAKITLNPITGTYASLTALNDRFQLIEDALNDDVLWRSDVGSEPNAVQADIDMNGYSFLNANLDWSSSTVDVFSITQDGVAVTDLSDQWFLGPKAAHPTTLNDLTTPVVEGVTYFNTLVNRLYTYDGSGWIFPITSAASNAVDVALADAGGNYAAVNVEAAFAELASTATGEGAAVIGSEDAGGYYTAADVEGQLQEIGGNLYRQGANVDANGTNTAVFNTIPTETKRIEVHLVDVNPSSNTGTLDVRIGNGTVSTSGYVTTTNQMDNTTQSSAISTASFQILPTIASANTYYGTVTLTRIGTTNKWLARSVIHNDTTADIHEMSGYVSLGGELTVLDIDLSDGSTTYTTGLFYTTYE